ncbi:hypothetical protein J5690_08415 [bacterium]|nr:hypothetical protein [bacterium]
MRKGNMSNKMFNLTHLGIRIIVVLMFIIYLRMYLVLKFSHDIFFSFIAPVVFFVVFLLYNLLLVHFHKRGFYTAAQAVEFYTKCRERDISLFHEENFEKTIDIYFSVFGTDKYFGEGTILTHMADIYAAGKKITEKQ